MKEQWNESTATAKGLYDPSFEHDNCGIGAVVNIKGIKTHQSRANCEKLNNVIKNERIQYEYFKRGTPDTRIW